MIPRNLMNFLGSLAVIGNIFCVFSWGVLQPGKHYEQMAFDRFERGKRANQDGDTYVAFSYFDDVAMNFPSSRSAERALFMSGRTAFRSLGRFDLARERFETYLERYGFQGQYERSVREYLAILKDAESVHPSIRDTVLWEFVQAFVEYDRGMIEPARSRLEWIELYYGNTKIGRRARELASKIAG